MAIHTLFVAGLLLSSISETGAGFRKWLSGKSPRPGVTWTSFLVMGGLGLLISPFLLALIASWSRGAWLGFTAGGVAMVILWPRRRSTGLLLAGLVLLAVTLVWQTGLIPSSVTDRLQSTAEFELGDLRDIELTEANYALLERLAFWEAAVGMAQSRLWFGIGFGNYEAAYAEFAPAGWPQSLGHAHNYYLNVLAEIGLLGLLAYLIFWVAVFKQNLGLLERLSGWPRGIALGLSGIWVALTIHHLVDKLYVNNLYLQLAILLAVQQLLVHLRQGGFETEILQTKAGY